MRAEYRQGNNSRILVFNQARSGSVTGASVGTNMLLNAVVVDKDAGKLAVGPSFIPTSAYGPYWVVATSPKPYTWAVISGGPPTLSSGNGCKTGSSGGGFNGNGEGFWIFARDAVPSPDIVSAARNAAAAKGFDLSVLVNVPQAGCTYEPFPERRGIRGLIARIIGR